MPARTGIFGGSFDPIHHGHIQLAEAAIRQARLEQLLLMPAAAQPLKPRGPIASSADRVEMACRAIAGRPEIQVSTHEVDRGGISYTFETLEALQSSFPDHRLLLVLGADALFDLPRWRRPTASSRWPRYSWSIVQGPIAGWYKRPSINSPRLAIAWNGFQCPPAMSAARRFANLLPKAKRLAIWCPKWWRSISRSMDCTARQANGRTPRVADRIAGGSPVDQRNLPRPRQAARSLSIASIADGSRIVALPSADSIASSTIAN